MNKLPTPAIFDTVKIDAFPFEDGHVRQDITMSYATYGAGDKIAVIGHTMTGNSKVHEWWPAVLEWLTNNNYTVICIDALNNMYSDTIENVSMNDSQALEELTLAEMGIFHADLYIGASMGGSRAFEWATQRFFKKIIVWAADTKASNDQIAHNSIQRSLIAGGYMKEARQLACLTYRNADSLEEKDNILNYINYIGDKFLARFGPAEYSNTLYTFNTHHVDPIDIYWENVHVFGVYNDRFMPNELACLAGGGEVVYYSNKHGHDSILINEDMIINSLELVLDKQGYVYNCKNAPKLKNWRQENIKKLIIL